MKCLNKHEEIFYSQEKTMVIGLDEAGRGPIAGPLVVAGVIFPKGYTHEFIYDSKKVSEKKRLQLFKEIMNDALYYKIEIVDPVYIDEFNIYRATQKTMEKIVLECPVCDSVLSDAMPLPNISLPTFSLVKGDTLSVSIAAASILAKVTRDQIMYDYDLQFPEYGFKNHKGYPTKKHLEALETFGVLEIHRRSYAPVQKQLQKQLQFDLQ